LEPEAPVAVDARGGYPTTFDTHGIEITKTYIKRHAIFLAGGDVYGLDSPAGIWKYLVERGDASTEAGGRMPLVVGATIYDLFLAKMKRVNYHEIAYDACQNASQAPVAEGLVGAGMGAAVGNYMGHHFNTKSGLGTSMLRLPKGIIVGAIAVPNSMGSIYDFRTGRLIAGARVKSGRYVEFEKFIPEYVGKRTHRRHTTLGVVATNALLSHEELLKLAQLAHNGLAMAIRPVHTSEDGDTVFTTSTSRIEISGERKRMIDVIGYSASICMATAIVRGVLAANNRASHRLSAKAIS
jgi:L-aminopeptidase/D-esterase-like protein